jgi:serine/threonine protein kinase
MDLLGPSLSDLLAQVPERHFSLKTTLMLAIIEVVHTHHIIHRDLKPDNFLMGTDQHDRQLFIIDFGLAKRFRNPETRVHIPYVEGKQLTGTSRYASITTHLGIEQSRRDDLESLGYVFVFMIKGALPWQLGHHRHHPNQDKNDICLERKMLTSPASLCADLPNEFTQYFEIVRALEFTEEPDYNTLRTLFRTVFARLGFDFDFIYDWTEVSQPTLRQHEPQEAPNSFFDDREITPAPDSDGIRSTKWNMLRRGVQSTALPRSASL